MDSALDTILGMIQTASRVMNRDPDMPLREFRDNLSETADKLRSASLTVTSGAVKLEEANWQRYPKEVVTASEDALDVGIATIEPMLEAIEKTYEKLDKAIEDELTCSECGDAIEEKDQFCASCGAEIEREPQHCGECGTEFNDIEYACPNCGTVPDLESVENCCVE